MATIESYSIKKNEIPEAAVNFSLLRQKGIEYISRLSGKLWTDYNIHDPGITILELLCYALTDLGYRTSFDIQDILTPQGAQQPTLDDAFIPAEKILVTNPVTIADLREWFIKNVTYLRNIWIEPEKIKITNPVSSNPIYINGFYRFTVDVNEEELSKKGIKPDAVYRFVKKDIRSKYLSVRNLCEDIEEVIILKKVNVGICMNLEIQHESAYEPILSEVNRRLEAYINNDKTLAEKKKQLNVSDAINLIMDIPGVINIIHLHFIHNKSDKDCFIETAPGFTLTLSDVKSAGCAIHFDRSMNETVVTRGMLPVKIENIDSFDEEEETETVPAKTVTIPAGKNRELDHYISIQDEFPKNYHLGREGISENASELRKVQRLQLKAYLSFFDQLLADYLAQLNSVKDLLSWRENQDEKDGYNTYSFMRLSDNEIVDFKTVMPSYKETVSKVKCDYATIIDTEEKRTDRKNRFLNHLLARFNEEFVTYSILKYVKAGKVDFDLYYKELIRDKINFLKSYACDSSTRTLATNYSMKEYTPSILEKRLYNKLGLDAERAGKPIPPEGESYKDHFGLHLYEHLLFRPLGQEVNNKDSFIRLNAEPNNSDLVDDPYSMRITAVVPGWLNLSEDFSFRNSVEEVIRMEIPAHIAVKICWIDAVRMKEIEDAYDKYLKSLSMIGYPVTKNLIFWNTYRKYLNEFVKIFSSLRNIYPAIRLYSPDDTSDYPSMLDYSMLSADIKETSDNK